MSLIRVWAKLWRAVALPYRARFEEPWFKICVLCCRFHYSWWIHSADSFLYCTAASGLKHTGVTSLDHQLPSFQPTACNTLRGTNTSTLVLQYPRTQYGDIPYLTLTFQCWMFPATSVGNHCTRKQNISHLSYVVHTKRLTADYVH